MENHKHGMQIFNDPRRRVAGLLQGVSAETANFGA